MSRAPRRPLLSSYFSRRVWSIFGLSLFLSCAAQATLYWDLNGAAAGAGGSAPAGTWDTAAANWNDNEYGTNATKAWSGDSEAGYAYILQRSKQPGELGGGGDQYCAGQWPRRRPGPVCRSSAAQPGLLPGQAALTARE